MAFVIFIPLLMHLLPVTDAFPTPWPVARTAQGTISGFSPVEGVEAFLGVPYAQPPVGSLRFQPPQAFETSTCQQKLVNASNFGPVCYQFLGDTPMNPVNWAPTTPESEDCLNLNIWRPAGTSCDNELPVMIWFYGGSFTEGGGSDSIYNMENFVKDNPEVIAVSFNYRLNIFGFPNLKNSSLTPNLGLLDQRLAVEWVRDNIKSFGGSPKKITLFGESAGAVSISAYSFAYKNDPIARGFILESGVATGIGDADAAVWDLVAINVGCKNNNDTEGKQREVDCMMAKPATELKSGVSNLTINPIGAPNGGSPTVDNKTVWSVQDYVAKAERGEFAKVPMLLGSNNNEGDGIINFSPEFSINKTLSDLATLGIIGCPVSQMAGLLHNSSVPVWRYRYMPIFPVVTFYDWVRTYHVAEVPMVLGSYPFLQPHKQPEQVEIDASKLLQKAWIAFANDPVSGLQVEMQWPKYDPKEPTLIQLFTNNTLDIDFVDPNTYDSPCTTIVVPSWQDLGAPAPTSSSSKH